MKKKQKNWRCPPVTDEQIKWLASAQYGTETATLIVAVQKLYDEVKARHEKIQAEVDKQNS